MGGEIAGCLKKKTDHSLSLSWSHSPSLSLWECFFYLGGDQINFEILRQFH